MSQTTIRIEKRDRRELEGLKDKSHRKMSEVVSGILLGDIEVIKVSEAPAQEGRAEEGSKNV